MTTGPSWHYDSCGTNVKSIFLLFLKRFFNLAFVGIA